MSTRQQNNFSTFLPLLFTSYTSVPFLHGKYYYTKGITYQNSLGNKAWHYTDVRRNHSSLKDFLHILIVSFKNHKKVLLSVSIRKNSTLLNMISLSTPESILDKSVGQKACHNWSSCNWHINKRGKSKSAEIAI